MKTLFKNGLILIDNEFRYAHILVEDSNILAISHSLDDLKDFDKEEDLAGKRLIPGFIDIHTHGAVGVDVNAATADEYEKICRFFATQGTTSWLCSILTDTVEQTKWCIDEYKKWSELKEHKGANIAGIHLEGPFLAPEYKGAMPEHLLQTGNSELAKEYQDKANGKIRYMTVSPEVKGNLQMIPRLRSMGIQVAIGHSGADYATANQAIENGAMAATHTSNAMRLLHQHEPAIWGSVLESNVVYCEMICDGKHLHPGTVRLIIKTKGLDKVIAVTDSIMAAGLPDGNYKLGVNDVIVKDGDARLVMNDARAGSTLTMIKAFKNVLEFTGRPIEEIIDMFTKNPAKLIGIYDKVGDIKVGKRADFVLLEENNDIAKTFVGGNKIEKTLI